ncbi:MAG: hypothetical protein RLZZ32_1045, partial [Cyanobacteriota bacterium]
LAKHPEIVVSKRYTSAAAGAYQFLPKTWSESEARRQDLGPKPSQKDWTEQGGLGRPSHGQGRWTPRLSQ